MTDREPEEGPQQRPQEPPGDPVNHHPPEEWRPGDPEDPMEGGPQPPGEPPHAFPHRGEASLDRPGPPEEGGHLPPPPGPNWAPPPLGDQGTGAGPGGPRQPPQGPPPGGPPMSPPPGGHPTGAPPEPVGGELSEGPSGPAQAGYEHAGYAPGYGEADAPGAGAGSHPGPPYRGGAQPGPGHGGQGAPSDPGSAYGAGYGAAGGGPPGGHGAQAVYGQPQESRTRWGRILGIGCGVLLLLLLVGGGCTAVGLFMAQSRPPTMGAPGTDDSGPLRYEEEPVEAEVTAGRTEFEPGPLYTSGDYTSVDVSVRNEGEGSLDVNPLYFSVIDASGALHSTAEAIGMDARELDAGTLVPGQSTSGVITVQGLVEADRVVFEPYYGEPVESPVL
ncbi:hypothetical protein SUDANB121_01109 [Nocardiopsis dassonvillei]|uniref:DUF4352 domain-containing protein n=1 Tax=Nocardiopsis dassonvillei TaxID=2014 RepID=UPI003F57BE56